MVVVEVKVLPTLDASAFVAPKHAMFKLLRDRLSL
jgi:hypothetical protein